MQSGMQFLTVDEVFEYGLIEVGFLAFLASIIVGSIAFLFWNIHKWRKERRDEDEKKHH